LKTTKTNKNHIKNLGIVGKGGLTPKADKAAFFSNIKFFGVAHYK